MEAAPEVAKNGIMVNSAGLDRHPPEHARQKELGLDDLTGERGASAR